MKMTTKTKRVYLKLVEELSELSVELLHAVNKPSKDNSKEINSEISDVENWISKFKQIKNHD